MEWQKLTTSGSNAHLEALHLLGATFTVAEVSNSAYLPDDQAFRLHNFIGDNDSWKDNNANSNASEDPWISTHFRTVDGVPHKGFDVSGFSQYGNPQIDTGPASGINPSISQLTSAPLTINQTANTLYLYTETSDSDENTYSITSPLINLTDYPNTKLAFYFYLNGANCGNIKVFTSTSNLSIDPSVATQQNISHAEPTGFGFAVLSAPVSQVGPEEIHNNNSSKWHRAEVDLTSFTEGYVWIVYESGNPSIAGAVSSGNFDFLGGLADFAISNVFLDFGSYIVPETEEIDNYELSLKVLGDAIKLYGLPEEDPHEEGQLYQDPDFINANQGYILISNG